MKFTVVIPSRDRPTLFKAALDSVLMQRDASFEIVVVNDGSDERHAADYRAIEEAAGERARFVHVRRVARGHGQSYALNLGATHASGDYLCFLDDDDVWTDPEHLARATRVIGACSDPVDLYLANQHAFAKGLYVGESVWLENLVERMGAGAVPDATGSYDVTVDDLFKCDNFGHLNTTVVRRGHFEAIGGLDENIRYECDRDFFLRAIDRARVIKYHPAVVSRHNIPDAALKTNMSTLVSDLEKRLYQLRVLDKAILFATHPAVRAHARTHKVFALKRISEQLARDSRVADAAYYAREALMVGFSWKWLAYCGWLTMRRIFR